MHHDYVHLFDTIIRLAGFLEGNELKGIVSWDWKACKILSLLKIHRFFLRAITTKFKLRNIEVNNQVKKVIRFGFSRILSNFRKLLSTLEINQNSEPLRLAIVDIMVSQRIYALTVMNHWRCHCLRYDFSN